MIDTQQNQGRNNSKGSDANIDASESNHIDFSDFYIWEPFVDRKRQRQETRLKVGYGIFFVILIILSFLGNLLIKSLIWMETEWDGVDFSTVMFQMRTPLAGVNSNVVKDYIMTVALPALIETAFLILCTFSLFLICWSSFPSVAKSSGAEEYFSNINAHTKIYENNYVKPTNKILTFPENKRNVVIIYMESMEATYSSRSEGGGKPTNLIPNLTELAKENTSFSSGNKLGGATMTTGSTWTMGALLTSSSGVPYTIPVEGNSMGDYSQFMPGLDTLGDVLEENGYHNYFTCGSDAAFGGRKLFFEEHGSYTIQDYYYAKDQNYIPEDYNVFWGMEDQKLFAMAKTELTKAANGEEPFNYTLLTVDTHHPAGYICDLCDYDGTGSTYAAAISCSDRQVTAFVKWIQEQSWYENTTIVLTGDHCSMAADFWDDLPDGYERHTYNCFINLPDDVSATREKNRLFSTEDLFPTILASMDVKIKGDQLGLGTNLFSDKDTLIETMGVDEYNSELSKYSDYYNLHFY